MISIIHIEMSLLNIYILYYMCVYVYTHIYNLIYIFAICHIFKYGKMLTIVGLGGGYMGVYILPIV